MATLKTHTELRRNLHSALQNIMLSTWSQYTTLNYKERLWSRNRSNNGPVECKSLFRAALTTHCQMCSLRATTKRRPLM